MESVQSVIAGTLARSRLLTGPEWAQASGAKRGSPMMHRILEGAVFVAMVVAPFVMIKLCDLKESHKSR